MRNRLGVIGIGRVGGRGGLPKKKYKKVRKEEKSSQIWDTLGGPEWGGTTTVSTGKFKRPYRIIDRTRLEAKGLGSRNRGC